MMDQHEQRQRLMATMDTEGISRHVDFVVPMVSRKIQLDERAPIFTYNFNHLFDLAMLFASVIERESVRRRFPFFKKKPSKSAIRTADALCSVARELAAMGNQY